MAAGAHSRKAFESVHPECAVMSGGAMSTTPFSFCGSRIR
jgi:hypothetical protein